MSVRENEKIMKFTKKFFYLIFLAGISNTANAALNLEEQIEADLFDFDPSITAMDVNEPTVTRGTTAETVGILTGIVEAQTILQTDLYHRTNPIARKNVIDLPIFQQFNTYTYDESTTFNCIPFFSQTFNELYYKDFNELKDYIDVDQKHLLRRIDDLQFTTFDIPRVLQLFGKMKLQEHRIGLLFNWTKTRSHWVLSMRTPFYYDEHNFYLNQTQRNQITELLGEGDPQFAFDHLVADFLSLGDTKLCFEYLVKQDYRYELAIGLRATLPTKLRMAKGIAGAYFDVDKNPKSLNLHTDLLGIPDDPLNDASYTAANKALMKKNATDFVLDALDHLSTLLLEQGSRNHFHVGVGPQMHSTMRFNSKCYMTNLVSCEVFTPANERRFFLVKNDKNAFDSFNWGDTDVDIENKLTFLNNQLKEKFFPPGYNVSVFPGLLLQSTTGLVFERRRVILTLGTDFWFHTKESFGTIYAPSAIKPLLNTEKAKMGTRYQSSLWVGLERNLKPDYTWNYGAKLNVGTWSSGIGSSTSFAFYIEKLF